MDKTTTNPSATDWREEYEEKFGHLEESWALKPFIESLLSRKEEEARKEVVGYIKAFAATSDVLTVGQAQEVIALIDEATSK